jgi:hypothetical protein
MATNSYSSSSSSSSSIALHERAQQCRAEQSSEVRRRGEGEKNEVRSEK